MDVDDRPAAAPPSSSTAILVVLCACSYLVVLNSSSLNVALPTIDRDLGATSSELQWIVASYSLVFASLLFTCGTIGDRIGRRLVLRIGLAIFCASSVLAALASSPAGLIGARGGMGLGAALVTPSTLSIITNSFPPAERARAIAIWASVTGLAGTTGPVATGLLLDHFTFRAVFLLNVVPALAILVGSIVLPTSRDPHRTPLDPVGAGLSMLSLGTFVYGLITAPQRGWLSAGTGLTAAATVLGLCLFVWWELRREHPMLDVRLFRLAPFRLGTMGMTVAFFGMFGCSYLLTQHFQLVLGYSPLGTAIRFLPTGIALGGVSALTPRLVRRYSVRAVAGTGLALVAASEGMFLFVDHRAGVWLVLGALMVLLTGLALTLSPLTNAVMSSVPASRPGAGSATNSSAREVGGALGVAVMGSVAASVYVDRLSSSPALPDGARASVGRSLASALDLARSLPRDVGPRLATDAQAAFAGGIRASVWIPLAVTAAVAVAVWRGLPDTGSEGGPLEAVEVTAEVQLGAPVLAAHPDMEVTRE